MMQRARFSILSSCLRFTFLILTCCVAAGHFPGSVWADDGNAPLVVRGSSTLLPIAEVWADAYGQISEASTVDIMATGTGEGIKDLLAGRADIAMASRPMSQEERAAAHDRGIVIQESIVARMGIAVIVHLDNPVSSIALSSLAEIFSGDVRSWKSVGGPDEPIIVVRKDSGWSPEFFRMRVMENKEFVADSVMVDSKEGVVAEVADRPWSIGVTGMPEAIPALDRIHLIRLVSGDSDEDSTYALSRPLFFFSVENSAPTQHFLEFVAGEKAQKMIIDFGLYPAQQLDPMSSDS